MLLIEKIKNPRRRAEGHFLQLYAVSAWESTPVILHRPKKNTRKILRVPRVNFIKFRTNLFCLIEFKQSSSIFIRTQLSGLV